MVAFSGDQCATHALSDSRTVDPTVRRSEATACARPSMQWRAGAVTSRLRTLTRSALVSIRTQGGLHSAVPWKGRAYARAEGFSGRPSIIQSLPSTRSSQCGDVRRDARTRCPRRCDGLRLEKSAFVSDHSNKGRKSRRPGYRSWTTGYTAPAWLTQDAARVGDAVSVRVSPAKRGSLREYLGR
jgi:hypothetical protein